MKLRVIHKDKTIEIITLVPPFRQFSGGIKSGDGTDYFFTHDGYFDGFGRLLSTPMNPAQAYAEVESIQQGIETENTDLTGSGHEQ